MNWISLCILFMGADAGPSKPDFVREVQPILAEHCLHCHGVDPAERKAKLRLDQREGALKGGESGEPAIRPGKPADSELIKRVKNSDADLRMPPAKHGKPLSPAQIATLERWIASGAEYATHWAFVPPKKAPLPTNAVVHPIDKLVVERLKKENLTPSPSADAATLCRRLYFDVIGLPPTPAEVAAFEKAGFEATLDALLASPRYGEKWARHWLDLARYSDTNGYEKDLRREQWLWRDWVIDALNRDQPYDRFVVEQIAGDLLPNPTQAQLVATGFLRNSMINEEGAIVPEQFRMFEQFDRMDCIGKAVMGLTTQCAQCHTHKFDPLTHDEYYGMFAFLNNAYEAHSWAYDEAGLVQRDRVRGQLLAHEAGVKKAHPNWQTELADWEKSAKASALAVRYVEFFEFGSISGLNHPTQEADRSILMKGHTSDDVFFIAEPELAGATGLQFETLPHRDLPFGGPGRSGLGTWEAKELEALVQPPGAKDWTKLKLVKPTADFSEPERKRGKDGKTGPVAFLVDGSDAASWHADRGPGRRNRAGVAVVQFEKPLTYPKGTKLKIVLRMGDMLGCCRVGLTASPTPTAPSFPHSATLAMQKPEAERTPEERHAVFAAWTRSLADAADIHREVDKLYSQWPKPHTSYLHLAEREPTNRRATKLLDRGEWDKPRHAVAPGVPAAFHPFPKDAPRNRLGFARWLVDPQSPLAARVAVNQMWQAVFGVGLVETSEDFGTRTPPPEYLDVLDRLAVDFMEHGWSRKRLLRTIITSATYRQSSAASAKLLEVDPRNRLLARGPRFRADAEVMRDAALAISGLLVLREGGPSVIPPVPQNVLDYNYTYPSYWKPAEGADRYRRTVYGFRKRSMPDPVTAAFDAPNGDSSCPRRVRSNTPLAALAGLNEPIFLECARALGLRVLKEAGRSDGDRADYVYLLCMSRKPTDAERTELLAFLQTQRQRIADGWINPREVLTGKPTELPSLPTGVSPQDAAAWTFAARVMLNLDETVSKN